MTCQEFQRHLPAFVDGELGVEETLTVETHAGECPRCQGLTEHERRFRQLLRRQPRESAPAEFRARVLARCRQEARRRGLRTGLLVATPAAAAALVVALLLPGLRATAPLVEDLVAAHIAYAQLERPAEFASDDRAQLEAWFRERARLRVTVPDYSPAGIRLVGGRITEVRERRAAYVLYEKGRTLLSVFILPAGADRMTLAGTRVTYRGQAYVTQERKGYRTVSWADGQGVFGLVSTLDYDALLECADRLREERASQGRI